ncbi:MFS transporter [Roseinatronobacter bogoriensis]|uniref:MFS transporter n=1 Tax=Roseinatronobacter bogoriensis subsp. barguzinensis TaxID=441209 RepID=A0A2K8KDQ9_9RHOB|nr:MULTISPECIES: MFS transporter [Rhodobaca]ATX64898.1 MFS transporter [Rhodobaca barguzinensis]MBB4208703.1 MFS family permease [Rhodobaca bogoriensis DSM 18756]TDW38029.1 putative MFS family arabinose efflux permease [Rhodobaca barguzinensis]TDY69801.1 putative MFS family arabinose efflux permease [Rhodobaca bogoriensis DSM 18756]
MFKVFTASWALLLGMMFLMVGNGVQGTLLGIRGAIEGFSTLQMSVVMSAYFAGFLFGSRMAPEMIRRVGHVRVFAALGSLISAVLILYAAIPDWIVWALLRVLIGFCFSGVYVTAESWLNNTASNENRGQALSLYMIVQMLGIIAAQALINFADPAGFLLFVIPSVLVSLAFAPILLSVSPAPTFGTTKSMSIRELYGVSPLGVVGTFLMGGVFAAMFGMTAVWGTEAGLSVLEISIFTGAIYFGGLIFQYPIGWLSDRMDRRRLLVIVSLIGVAGGAMAVLFDLSFIWLVGVALIIGGISNPLYSLLVAYTNDYLEADQMAAASGGLLFVNGVGAILGPLTIGWLMGVIGPSGFFLFIIVLMMMLVIYAVWRMTQRPSIPVAESGPFAAVSPVVSAATVEAVYTEMAEQQTEST